MASAQAWTGIAIVAVLASMVAFVAMDLDKRRAQRGDRRIQESSFALFALLGGWPGVVAGGIAFRHKTKSRWFQVKITAAALAHAAMVGALWWMG